MKKITLALLLALGVAACGGGGGGGSSDPAPTPEPKPVVTPPPVDDPDPVGGVIETEVISEDTVEVTVFVTDENSLPRTDLTAENFTLLLDNNTVAANIVDVSAVLNNQKDAFSATILLDESDSMRETDPEDYRIHATTRFIDALDDGETIQLFAFAHPGLNNEHVVWIPSNFYRLTDSFVSSLDYEVYADLTHQEGGVTNLYDSALQAIAITAAESPSANRTLIVFTDGRDNVSSSTADDVIAAAVDNGITVYTVGLGVEVDLSELSRIAEETGGTFVHATNADELYAIFDSLDEVLNGTAALYTVTIKVVGDLSTLEGTEGTLNVTIPDSTKVIDVPFVL